MEYIGIDPGKKGGIAIVKEDGTIAETHVTPIKNDRLDSKGLYEILAPYYNDQDGVICIEQVHSIHGTMAKANFSFGGIYYATIAVAELCLPVCFATPKTWQKVMFAGIPEITHHVGDKAKKDTKGMAEVAAKRLWPDEDFRASCRCTVNHDGIIDALLIAEFLRKTLTS